MFENLAWLSFIEDECDRWAEGASDAAADPHRNYQLIDVRAMIIGMLNRDETMMNG